MSSYHNQPTHELKSFQDKLKSVLAQSQAKINYNRSLRQIVPKDTNNNQQSFYREIESLQSKYLVFKLGWKITSLAPEQTDLTMFCLALLGSKIKMPIKSYLRPEEGREGNQLNEKESLWIQVNVFSPQRDVQESQKSFQELQKRIFEFGEKELVPRIKDFICEQITWGKMMEQTFDDAKVAQKFEKQVIEYLNRAIYKYQFVK